MYKKYASVLFDAIKDKNLPTSVKVLIGVGIGYILSPLDLIPDLGLPLGVVDDTVLAAILIAIGGKMILDKRNKTDGSSQNHSSNDDDVIDI